MVEVIVDAIPTLSDTFYVAKVYMHEKTFSVTNNNSMRELLTSLKEKLSEANALASVHIVGEFNDADLTEDDHVAWATPIGKF